MQSETEDDHVGHESPNASYFDGLSKHRDALLNLRNDQYRTFDKAILGVSSGAFGISIAFMDKLGGNAPIYGKYLIAAWLAFAAAIGLNIVSYLTGAKDAFREIKKVDRCLANATEYSSGGNLFRGLTEGLNYFALALFIIGVICLALFAYPNVLNVANEHVQNLPALPPSSP